MPHLHYMPQPVKVFQVDYILFTSKKNKKKAVFVEH